MKRRLFGRSCASQDLASREGLIVAFGTGCTRLAVLERTPDDVGSGFHLGWLEEVDGLLDNLRLALESEQPLVVDLVESCA